MVFGGAGFLMGLDKVEEDYAEGIKVKPQETTFSLSVKEAVLIALARNFDIQVGIQNPAIEQADVQQAEGEFDPQIAVQLTANQNRTQDGTIRSFLNSGRTLDLRGAIWR